MIMVHVDQAQLLVDRLIFYNSILVNSTFFTWISKVLVRTLKTVQLKSTMMHMKICLVSICNNLDDFLWSICLHQYIFIQIYVEFV